MWAMRLKHWLMILRIVGFLLMFIGLILAAVDIFKTLEPSKDNICKTLGMLSVALGTLDITLSFYFYSRPSKLIKFNKDDYTTEKYIKKYR